MGLAARQKSPSKLTSQPRNRGKDAVLFLKIMQGKYGRNMIHTNKAIAKATDSNLWKSLVSFWEQIENLSVWAVGIGRTVSAWDHCWIAPNIKIADLDITISDNLVRAKVRELITDSRDWNWQLLEDWLPVNILRKILAIHPPDDTNGEDARLWPEDRENPCLIVLHIEDYGVKVKRLESLYPDSNPRGYYPDPGSQTNGVRIQGDFHEIRNSIADVVVVARLLNATLAMPEIQSTTSSKGISSQFKSFAYLYNEDQFICSLAKDVKVVRTLPKYLKDARRKKEILVFKVPYSASPFYYLHHVLQWRMLAGHSPSQFRRISKPEMPSFFSCSSVRTGTYHGCAELFQRRLIVPPELGYGSKRVAIKALKAEHVDKVCSGSLHHEVILLKSKGIG
ncbi:hypothetical protein P8452_59100 [Trifolium repens]|nr:hypothetical protein P8452_59100 [Trifolium repens]